MTVAELGVRMSGPEFMEWIAYENVHLSDSWYQNGLLRLLILKVCGDKRAKLDDLLPRRRKREARPAGNPVGRLMAWARGYNKGLGGPEIPEAKEST